MEITRKFQLEPIEIAVSLSQAEIMEALSQAPSLEGEDDQEKLRLIKRAVNGFALFMQAVPENVVALLAPKDREIIARFFTDQGARFKVEGPLEVGQ